MSFEKIKSDLGGLSSPQKAKASAWFFKTGPGQYGEGDVFIGVTMPEQRQVAKKYFRDLVFSDIKKLLDSDVHEHRMTGLICLVYKYEKFPEQRQSIYDFYLKNSDRINNWDLVDVTTPKIVGAYLLKHPEQRKKIFSLVKSNNLWERRIAVLATYPLLKAGQFEEVLRVSETLLTDKHDLIHKAVGWMLRELGKVELKVLLSFLDKYYLVMPRTMLRYSLEKLTTAQKNHYMGRSA